MKRNRDFQCMACRTGKCVECIDVIRVCLDLEPRCTCTRKNHRGEPHGAPEHVCNEICEMVNG